MSKRKRKKLRGTVQKVLKPILPWEPEKAEISVEGADDLYREIRYDCSPCSPSSDYGSDYWPVAFVPVTRCSWRTWHSGSNSPC
jgi:hypothetical protein